jgi:predicted nucleic acid-binding Zn ribbon protein
VVERLSDILNKEAEKSQGALKSCQLVQLWGGVVDERVKKNTEPVKVRNRVLYVTAKTPAWAQELSFLKKEIIEKFNRRAGEEAIRDVRFKSGDGETGWQK